MALPAKRKYDRSDPPVLIPFLYGREEGTWLPLSTPGSKRAQAEFAPYCSFEELIYNDERTRYARCIDSNCRKQCTKPFFYTKGENANYLQKKFVAHMDESPLAKRIIIVRPPENSQAIRQFFRQNKFSDEEVKQLRKLQCEMIASGTVPIYFFSTPQMANFMAKYTELTTRSANTFADQVKSSDVTLKKLAKDEDQCIKVLVRGNIDFIENSAEFCLLLDHQFNRSPKESHRGNKRLGLAMQHTNTELVTSKILLTYKPMFSSGKDANVPEIERILEGYGLLNGVRRGNIPVCCDMAALAIAKKLSPLNYNGCFSHHISNFVELILTNLAERTKIHWLNAKDEIEKFENLVQGSNELKYESRNAYLRRTELDEVDKTALAQILVECEIDSRYLSANEIKKKAEKKKAILKYYPTIEKCEKSTRFRKYVKSLINLKIANKPMVALEANTHPQSHLALDHQMNTVFLDALMPFLVRLAQMISLAESENVGSGFALREYELFGAISARSYYGSVGCRKDIARSCLQSVIEHLFGYWVTNSGEKQKSTIPKRIHDKEIAQYYLYLETHFLNLEIFTDELEKSKSDPMISTMLKLIETETESWKHTAHNYIISLSKSVSGSASQESTPSQECTPSQESTPSQECHPSQECSPSQEQINEVTKGFRSKLWAKKAQKKKSPSKEKTIEDELALYDDLDVDDLEIFEERMKAKKIPKHNWPYYFSAQLPETMPKLKFVSKLLYLGSRQSSSLLERIFSRTSKFNTDDQRQSLLVETIESFTKFGFNEDATKIFKT